jgi:hypothetical protein
MRLTSPNGPLMVSPDTEISLKLTNSALVPRGSYTLPFTLPWCSHNLEKLNNPERGSRAKHLVQGEEFTIEANGFNERGYSNIVNLSPGDGVELSMLTREGAFWEWAKRTNLRSINIPHESGSMDISIPNFHATLQNYIDAVWPEVDFAFFPIASDLISLDEYNQTANYNVWSERKLCITDYTIWNNPGDLYRNDGADRSSLITPFIYLNAVINWIAGTYGYVVDENFLASTAELRSSVVLNRSYNTTLVGYFVSFSQLLPNVSVMDFLSAVEGMFGCNFYVFSNSKTISIKPWKDYVYSKPTPCHGQLITKEYTDRKSFKLSAKHINSPYISILNRAIDNPFFAFDTQPEPITDNKIYHTAASPNYSTHPNKFVFSIALQSYFRFEWEQNGGTWEYKAKCVHSNFYNRAANPFLEEESLEIKAQLVPMIPVTCRQFYKNGSSNDYFTYTLIVPHFNTWDWIFSNENGVIGLDNQPSPISFAFNRGRQVNIDFGTTLFGKTNFDMPWGSVDIYDKDGDVADGATIAFRFVADGNIHESFYKEKEFFMNNSTAIYEIMHSDSQELLSKKICELLQIDGVNIIIESLDVSITHTGAKVVTAKARGLKPFISG